MVETLKRTLNAGQLRWTGIVLVTKKVGNNFIGVSLEVCLGDFENLIGIDN
jgi:hypothetical protein